MRIGCFGCLTIIVAILVIVVGVAGFVFLSGNIFEEPEVKPLTRYTRADGFSAQQKLFELVRREEARSSRTLPVMLTEAEMNAFLANHLAEAGGLALNPLSVRFTPGMVELQGRTLLRHLLQGPGIRHATPYIPEGRLDQPIWVTVRGRIVLEPAGSRSRAGGRFDITDLSLGKQPLGPWLLTVLLGPTAARLTHFQVPRSVESVTVEDSRIVIQTR